jgi:hypothetical protein
MIAYSDNSLKPALHAYNSSIANQTSQPKRICLIFRYCGLYTSMLS